MKVEKLKKCNVSNAGIALVYVYRLLRMYAITENEEQSEKCFQ